MSYFEPPAPPETVTLFTDGLLSKWGFCDGDLLDWLYEFGKHDSHVVLCAIVRQKLLPALAQKVEVEEISTIHNPIRAHTVDGKDVTHMHCASALRTDGLLTPASVDVSGAEVLAIARALSAEQIRTLPPSLYQIIGAFDSYGACRWLKIYRDRDGKLSQNYPGHSAAFIGSSHKRWRWWVDKGRLDGPELMHWTPDAEEMDRIERIVAETKRFNPDIPRFSLDGQYPNWKQVYDPPRPSRPTRIRKNF